MEHVKNFSSTNKNYQTGTSKINPLRWSSIEDILPPFPHVKNPEDLIITFDVNLKTQVLTRFRKSKRFEFIEVCFDWNIIKDVKSFFKSHLRFLCTII